MKGQKTIILPFEFSYADAGVTKKEFAVTVRAPSLDQFKVHATMVAYAGAADIGLSVAFSGVKRLPQAAIDQALDAQREVRAEVPETEEEMVSRVISTFASGLGDEKFPDFMAYLIKTLKNNPRLATVGETNIPLTDLTFQNIADEGGMDAVNTILATFAGFFLVTPQSKSAKKSGENTQASQPSGPAVH